MRIPKRLFIAVIAASAGLAFLGVALADGRPAPAWCNYPDPASVAALEHAVDVHTANIAKYSPGQPVDRFTLQLDLMTMCAS